jgi:FAD/FMN-containing dehydrogenase
VEFRSIVSPEWVFTDDDDVALHNDAYSPFTGDTNEFVASAAVAPASVEEIQSIVRAANHYKIPLYAISTGKNLGYGGSAPRLSGSVVLDLKRMNKTIEINETEALALVEPGVSYFQLYDYIRENKLKLWIDCPDPGWGSPIGNALDHVTGYTRYRDHFDAHCGMEVVLPSGDLVRPGMGAMPGSRAWQSFRYGCGSIVDGLFSQSNMGIVTKMGFWLMPEPEASIEIEISVPRHDDIHPFIATLFKLHVQGVIDTAFGIDSPLFSSLYPDATEFSCSFAIPDPEPAVWDAMAREKDVASWRSRFWMHGAKLCCGHNGLI